MEQEDLVLRKIPSSINLGLMSVKCDAVRDEIASRHALLRNGQLNFVADKAKVKTLDVCASFEARGRPPPLTWF